MKGKKVVVAVMAGIVCLSLFGCGNDSKEKKADTSAVGNGSVQEKKIPPEVALKNALEERSKPAKLDVSRIDVSKEDMDKLIPIARNYELTEDDVRYTAAVLKRCGLDLNRIEPFSDDFGRQRATNILLKTKPDELPLEYRLCFEFKDVKGTKVLSGICVVFDGIRTMSDRLDGKIDLLTLHAINPIGDGLFIKKDAYERIRKTAEDATKEKDAIDARARDVKVFCYPYFDETYENVSFANLIGVVVNYGVASKVYGAGPEGRRANVFLDFDGNVQKMIIDDKNVIDQVYEKNIVNRLRQKP